jgi:paraquat-inducible protein B
MIAKANFFKIGVFVILGLALIVAVIIIFGAGLFQKPKVYFETYFDSSVYGLNVGSSVLLRGVKMGDVSQITFARNIYNIPENTPEFTKYASYVVIVCAVDRKNLPELTTAERKANAEKMVARGLRMRLSTNILTGQGYLEADMLDPNRFPPMEVPWKPKHIYIPSAPGELTTLKNSVDKILAKLEEVDVGRISEKVEKFVDSLNKAVVDANVGQVSDEARALLADARTKIKDIDAKEISDELREVLASVNENVKDANIPELADRLDDVVRRIDELVAGSRPDVQDALANIRTISANLRELSESLKQNPSEIIFSKPPPQSEVSK